MLNRSSGTRFRLFPQAPPSFPEPETVWVSSMPGSIGAGPADARMYVVDAIGKPPYDPPAYAPPYYGPQGPSALPGPDGHFDHIPIESQAFLSTHLYGAVHFVLDVWEKYLERRIRWSSRRPSRIELVPLVKWDNAHSGPGFIEMGARYNREGEAELFSLNLDVIAHEVGHAVLFSELGTPSPSGLTEQFLAFHESLSDVSALLTALHFENVVSRLLEQTGGNLYVLNMLSRIGELSDHEQIRIADNRVKLDDVNDLKLDASGEWIDPTGAGRNAHDLGQPLTGAIFDLLVEEFQAGMVARGVIPPERDPRGWTREQVERETEHLLASTGGRLTLFERPFRASLAQARDTVGFCVGRAIESLSPENFSFDDFAGSFMDATRAIGTVSKFPALRENFTWRGIEPAASGPGARPWRQESGRRLGIDRPYAVRVAELQAALREGTTCGFRLGRHGKADALAIRRYIPHEERRSFS